MLRMICTVCRISRDVCLGPGDAPPDEPCRACGAGMVYEDPTAATLEIARTAARPGCPESAWHVIRRELVIGLAWGLGLAALVVYPLSVEPAYRSSDGRIRAYPPTVHRDADGNRVYMPGTSPLEWGEWATLVVEACGTVVLAAGGIGSLVGAGKLAWRRRREAT